jgi:hypothetical protein
MLFLIQAVAQARQEAGTPAVARNLYDDPSPGLLVGIVPGIDPEAGTVEEEPILASSISAGTPYRGIEGNDRWSIGPFYGFIRTRSADKICVFGGLQGRVWLFDFLAAQVAGSIHRTSYQSASLIAHQYPVQLSAVLSPFPQWEAKPYVVGGAGWYDTRLEYRSLLSSLYPNTHNSVFGGQGGLGVELKHGSASASLEAGYVIVNLKANGLKAHDFDYWQIDFGINFLF